MAAGAQNLLLALAVPLISPFELQHQIFREHPAPEQLFLIATPQHCCPCLYINIYSEPRTEHQSLALPPPPALAGPAPPPAPALPLQPLAGQEGGCAEMDLGPTVLLLLHRLGWTRPCPVPAACAVPPCGALGEERGPRHALLAGRSSPHLQQRPGLPPTAPHRRCPHRRGPDSPTSPGHRRFWRPRAELVEMQHDGLEEAEGGGWLCGVRCWSAQQGRESRSPDLGWVGVFPVAPACLPALFSLALSK